MNQKEAILKAIEIVGSANELAARLSVSYKTVLDWKNGRTGISLSNSLKIEKVTNGVIKAKTFIPDYPWDDLK